MKDFHISQVYDPKEHTGKLRVEHHPKDPAGTPLEGDWPEYNVYLVCHDGTVDWVQDFDTKVEADAFLAECEAEIILMKGYT